MQYKLNIPLYYDSPQLVWLILVMLIGVAPISNKASTSNINSYTEIRVDVIDCLHQMIFKAGYATDSDSWSEQVCQQINLDFSKLDDKEKQIFEYKIYGGSIIERNIGKEVESFALSNSECRLTSVSSRELSLKFTIGLIYCSQNQLDSKEIYCRDTLTIALPNAKVQHHEISASSFVKNGGMIILSEGDTIKNTVIHISRYEFSLPDAIGESAKATYTNTRWIVPTQNTPVVEWIKYSGWNNNKEIATLSVEPKQQQRNSAQKNIYKIESQSEFQHITISDISGKILWKYYSDEIAEYDIPPGWYIITKEYSGKSISEKIYLE